MQASFNLDSMNNGLKESLTSKHEAMKTVDPVSRKDNSKIEYDWFPCFYKGWVCRDVNYKKKLDPFIQNTV